MVECLALNLSHPYLTLQVRLIDLPHPDIQIIYGLQIDIGTQLCVNCSLTGIFKNKFMVHGEYIRFPTPNLILIYLIFNYSTAV